MKTETPFAAFPTAADAPPTGVSTPDPTGPSTLTEALPIAAQRRQRHTGPQLKEKEPKNGNGQSGSPDPLLTVEEFAAQLRVTQACVRKWILERRVAVVKVGRLVRLPTSEIHRIIHEGSRPRAQRHFDIA